jgi:hypothetical protein
MLMARNYSLCLVIKNEHDCDSVFKLYESSFRVTDVGRFLPDSPTSTNGRFFH